MGSRVRVLYTHPTVRWLEYVCTGYNCCDGNLSLESRPYGAELMSEGCPSAGVDVVAGRRKDPAWRTTCLCGVQKLDGLMRPGPEPPPCPNQPRASGLCCLDSPGAPALPRIAYEWLPAP